MFTYSAKCVVNVAGWVGMDTVLDYVDVLLEYVNEDNDILSNF